jgi:hypothetical protein
LRYEDFRDGVRQVVGAHAGAAGLVPIPLVRKALGDRVSAQQFDALMCALQQDGLVHLLTHVDYDRLSEEEQRACVRHPSGVVAYWVCWV